MGKSILVADDSATLRKIVELAFSDTPFHVESVGSGAEALERLRAHRPDVVLAGVDMPEPSGYEICRQVKHSDRPVPVLLLAGTFEPYDEDRARACGADGFLLKPFESKVLVERVDELLVREAEPPGEGAPAESEPAVGVVLSAETIEALAEAVARKLAPRVVDELLRRDGQKGRTEGTHE